MEAGRWKPAVEAGRWKPGDGSRAMVRAVGIEPTSFGNRIFESRRIPVPPRPPTRPANYRESAIARQSAALTTAPPRVDTNWRRIERDFIHGGSMPQPRPPILPLPRRAALAGRRRPLAGAPPGPAEPMWRASAARSPAPTRNTARSGRRGFDLALDGINGGAGRRRHQGPPARIQLRGQPVRPAPIRRRRAEIRRRPAHHHRARRFLRPPPRWRPRRSISAPNWCSSASPTRTPTSPRAATTCGATPPTRPRSSRSSSTSRDSSGSSARPCCT